MESFGESSGVEKEEAADLILNSLKQDTGRLARCSDTVTHVAA